MKLWEPGGLLPGEAGYWMSDLDLWCRLHSLSWGVEPYSGRLLTGSLDIFLSRGAAVFEAGLPIFSVLDSVGNGLDLFQMLFLDLSDDFIYGTILLPDEGF